MGQVQTLTGPIARSGAEINNLSGPGEPFQSIEKKNPDWIIRASLQLGCQPLSDRFPNLIVFARVYEI